MKVIAKITSYMEGDPKDVWIVKGEIYDLKFSSSDMYRFINQQGDIHFVGKRNFDKYFKVVG